MEMKQLLTKLGVLFGINQIVGKSSVLALAGHIEPAVFSSLQNCKERILK